MSNKSLCRTSNQGYGRKVVLQLFIILEFLPTFFKQTPTESPRVSTWEGLDLTLIAGFKELGKELILLLILLNYHNIYSYYSFSVKIGEMISRHTRDLTILGILKVYWPKQPSFSLGISRLHI